ncbi:transglycosylase domain-containing protein [Candidatus Oscillochloris fontis]|uniref:transglycosylase domain-containing protein n=1 Tax=Candidatus Oscillochloris fontis TaxID=2496868 RepID=UPI001EE7DAFB|nr:transglycosylase domain-containing protein [Candidatus Oscillochloris fontis]
MSLPRDRFTRRTYGGHPTPRRPAYPRLLRPKPRPPARLPRILAQLFVALTLLVVLIISGVLGAAYSAYAQTTASLKPRLDALNERDLFQTSRIFDRNGTLLYEFFDAGKRTNVSIDQISPLLIHATVAIEDKTFFTNQGIDLNGIVRTAMSSLQAGEETGGASTITQQVIKNYVLTGEERDPERRYERKVKEILLAQELDKLYTKEAILELYLNENFYGNLAYGIEAASEVYFGVQAKDLTLNQASLLAGLPQLPSVYNPINYLERDAEGGFLPGVYLSEGWEQPDYPLPANLSAPRWRQISVLRRMVEDGYVNADQARIAVGQPLRFAAQEVPLNAPHFVFYVRDLVQEQYGQAVLTGGGLRITTTLDLDLQMMVQRTAAERIAEIRARNIHNAAVVVMQPNTGQILAMVGSIDYNAVETTRTPGESGNVIDGQVNVATRERQPGSALKPFTYLAAMEQGISPETVLWDVPTEFPLSGGEWYAPLNYNAKFNGPVRMRNALANSLNIPAVRALKLAGISNTLDLLDRVGIKSGLKRGESFYGLSLTLGGGEVTPLELTTAYNTLASGGRYYAPSAILEISDATGEVLEHFTPSPGPQVVDKSLVAIITDMMSDDRARAPVWGLNSPLQLSLPAAVKTGTSNDWRDAWAAGFTPFVTVAVWTGNNNNEPTEKVESLTGGGIIWRNVMEEIFVWIAEKPRYQQLFAAPFDGAAMPTSFSLPDDGSIIRRPICALPGPFGGYNEELFTKPMLTALITPTNTLAPGPALDARLNSIQIPCSAFTKADVVRIPSEEEWSDDGILQIQVPSSDENNSVADMSMLSQGNYCRPVAGQTYPDGLRKTIYIWKIPPPDLNERVRYVWSGGSAASGGMSLSGLPECTPDMFEPPVPIPPVAGAILMPNLKGLGENQAKEALAALGIPSWQIYVDYQTRERIPSDYDRFVPYAVVSTLPAAGDWIIPGTTVVLGIRAPDTAPAPALPTAEPVVPTPPPNDPLPFPAPPPPPNSW